VPVRSSDEIVHRLIAGDPEVRSALEKRFGTTSRKEIGEIVFAAPDELAWLEGLLHPRVRDDYLAWREGLDAEICVVEVPLLYEAGGEALFDVVVAITAPEEIRSARSALVGERSSRLIPDDEKLRRADFGFVNDGSLEELDDFVERVLEELRSRR
jgi:dephospho-CoA kinase